MESRDQALRSELLDMLDDHVDAAAKALEGRKNESSATRRIFRHRCLMVQRLRSRAWKVELLNLEGTGDNLIITLGASLEGKDETDAGIHPEKP